MALIQEESEVVGLTMNILVKLIVKLKFFLAEYVFLFKENM